MTREQHLDRAIDELVRVSVADEGYAECEEDMLARVRRQSFLGARHTLVRAS